MSFLELSEVQLYYEIYGIGEPVLFIQGVGVVGHGWRPQAEPISAQYKTITFDNRGIGKSTLKSGSLSVEKMAEDTLALLDHLHIPSAHIVGHSMGGAIAIELAVQNPQRVKTLSLLCTFASGKQATQVNSRIFWLGMKTRIGTKRSRRNAFLEILYSRDFFKSCAHKEALAQSVGATVGRDLAFSPAIIMQQLKALSRHDRSSDLSKLARIPTLVVSAAEDPIALPEYGRQLADAIPNSKFILMEDSSHGVVLERPTDINRLLLDHFTSQEL